MKVLLATHNFYPYHNGGTEIYVFHLAKYLENLGITVNVISTIKEADLKHEKLIFDDDNLSICEYLHDGVAVFGAYAKYTSTIQVYSRTSTSLKESYCNFFKERHFDIVHMHGFTSTIGLDIIYSLKIHNESIKTLTSFHTCFSDPKETLTFGNTFREKPQNINHTADFISYRLGLPYWLSRYISWFLPSSYINQLPALFNAKYLVNLSLKSFKELMNITDEWWVYSNGIKTHLQACGIEEKKMINERHGIAPIFFNQMRKSENIKTIFLFNSRPVAIKGIETLLKAWLSISEDNLKELWISAFPSEVDQKLNNLITPSQFRKDIRWLGPFNQQKMAEVYKKVDFVVVPSECFEIGPLIIHEAVANNCQIIASDIGGCKELLEYYDMHDGIFKTGNRDDLIKKINNATKHSANLMRKVKSFNEHFDHLVNKSNIYA